MKVRLYIIQKLFCANVAQKKHAKHITQFSIGKKKKSPRVGCKIDLLVYFKLSLDL